MFDLIIIRNLFLLKLKNAIFDNILNSFSDAAIRLYGGINRLEGRVEIMYQGIWGTICDDGWDDTHTGIVCRELGLFNGTETRQNQFASSPGPVWLRQVNCSGNESKLSHCMHDGAGNVGNCSHASDVAIRCSSYGMYKCKVLYVGTSVANGSGHPDCLGHLEYFFVQIKVGLSLYALPGLKLFSYHEH